MKHKFFALTALCVLLLNTAAAAFADTNSNINAKQTAQLVALLPASDAVVTMDARRFLSEALPQILSGNQPMLSKINGKIDEIKSKTGIDLRQFEQFAAGISIVPDAGKDFDYEPVLLTRGQIDAGALLGVAKLAAKGKYREEKVGDKIIYVFSLNDAVAKNDPNAGKNDDQMDKIFGRLLRETAITAVDSKTLAIGTLARVRQTLEAKTSVGADVTALLYRKQTVVMNMAAKIPNGMSALLPLEDDELGKNIDAIQYIYGAMDVSATGTSLQMTAKTRQNAQAQGLHDTMKGLQLLGKAFLGSAKGADKQVYARMIENIKFSRVQNELTLDLEVPQSDIDVLIGEKK